MRERFGAAIGVAAYLAGVAATTAVLLRHGTGLTAVRPVPPAAALAVVGALLGAIGYRRVEPARRLRTNLVLLAVQTPLGAAAVGFALLDAGASNAPSTLAPAALATVLGASGVAVLRRTGSTLHARRLAADALFLVELPPTARTPSRRGRAVVAALGLATLVGAALGVLVGWRGWALLAVLAAGSLGVELSAPRDVWITEAGVRFESLGGIRLVEWDQFEGYSLGEQLVLLRAGPLRRDVAFDAESVSGPALAVLGDLLPRSETRAVSADGLDAPVGESPEPAGT